MKKAPGRFKQHTREIRPGCQHQDKMCQAFGYSRVSVQCSNSFHPAGPEGHPHELLDDPRFINTPWKLLKPCLSLT